jgi:prepilin-type N-terminal cleavage/methylation domain-containing protein
VKDFFKKGQKRVKKAFTLLELLVVILILGLLAAFVVPNIIGAGIILTVTYFIAKFVISILSSILDSMTIDTMPARLGIQDMFSKSFTPTKLISGAIMFFSMLTAATAAINTLGIGIISDIFAKILQFGGGILVGGIILLIGNFLSSLAYIKLSSSNPTLAGVARIAILGLVLAMGLKAMGLADNIVNMAFGFTIGAVAIAASLAFGFGGRDAAKKVADKWADKF